ncbi:MAG: MXAN_5187 C-terminal domain-containing protein, partial [Myxococcota bacterium]
LNQLMGVQEDDTDDEGRPSLAPSATAFQGALDVDENASGEAKVDMAAAAALAAEPADQYYPRIFREYIQAKKSIGDPVDHITEASFIERIKQREQETSSKTGHPVRYQVQLRGREVVLIAVQLP